jgi:putative ABC transport system ATP-binding protein
MLRLHKVSKSYREATSTRKILDDISFELPEGEASALVGRSGSGKSTLLNLISGLDLPDQGQIYFDSQDLVQLNEQERSQFRRREIGFIFQSFHLLPSLSVLENVEVSLELLGRPNLAKARDLLDAVGLASFEKAFPDRLSGGEQQRVAIARALVHSPSLILADEPTGNLDEENAEKILELLLNLSRETKATCLVVTHSLEVADKCNSVFTLARQKITRTSIREPGQVGDAAPSEVHQ